MSASRRFRLDPPLAWVLAIVLVKQLAWWALMPLWQIPDEPAHFAYVQYWAESGHLPRATRERPQNEPSEEAAHTEKWTAFHDVTFHPDVRQPFTDGEDGPGEAELRDGPRLRRLKDGNSSAATYPPLYYALARVPYHLFAGGTIVDQVFAIRLVSVVLVVVTTWAASAMALELGLTAGLAACFALFVGMQPMLSMMGAAVNNDLLVIALCTVASWLLARIGRQGVSVRRVAGLALVVALGVLTKVQMLPFAVLVPPCLAIQLWLQRPGVRRAAIALGLYGGVVAAAYLGWNAFQAWRGAALPPLPATPCDFNWYFNAVLWGFQGRTMAHMVNTMFWAAFGWLDTVFADPVYGVLGTLVAVGAAGSWVGYRRGTVPSRPFHVVAWGLGLGYWALLILGGYQLYSHGEKVMLQGRYLLPVWAAIAWVVFTGCLSWVPESRRRLVAVVLATLGCLFNTAAGILILGRFYV
ncbi:MAG: hypothetical protein VKP72_08800 [bacterium]|nr:hypothetical protein [bacterium]